jgi:hypothetical protein
MRWKPLVQKSSAPRKDTGKLNNSVSMTYLILQQYEQLKKRTVSITPAACCQALFHGRGTSTAVKKYC